MVRHDLQKIIWLASYPKSGNTWFRVFLDNILTDSDTCIGINQLNNTMIASSRNFLDTFSGVSSANLTEFEIEELRPKVYTTAAEQSENMIYLKVHDAWRTTYSGKPLFPSNITKGIVYIVRNPLDIAVSFSYHASESIDTTIKHMNSKEFAFCENPKRKYQQVRQLLSDWSGHITSWIDESGLPSHIIRYEDMLDNPIPTFLKALEFLEINIEERVFHKSINASKFDVLRNAEKEGGFKEKPIKMKSFFREGKSGKWAEILNTSQQNEIIQAHYTQMKRFGYIAP